MFDYLKERYTAGSLTIANLKKAVVKVWITADQFQTITGQAYVA